MDLGARRRILIIGDMFTTPRAITADTRPLPTIDLAAVTQLLRFPERELASVLEQLGTDGAAIALGDEGELRFDSAFTAVGQLTERWDARARLYWARPRLVRFTRVHLEAVPWAKDFGELSIRPVARTATSWSSARLGRYLDLARRAADEIADRARAYTDALGATTDTAARRSTDSTPMAA